MALAEQGLRGALEHDVTLRSGVTTVAGRITNPAVAEALDAEVAEPLALLS